LRSDRVFSQRDVPSPDAIKLDHDVMKLHRCVIKVHRNGSCHH